MVKTLDQRASGVLLHLSSLPGPIGIGDLGPRAHAFIGFLAQAGQSWWQMLPTGPTGAGDSPYQSISAFAGNPLLVSLERLAEDGWLDPSDLPGDEHGHPADFAAAHEARWPLLRKAWNRFRDSASAGDRLALEAFVEQQRDWLDDYSLFVALKQAHQGRPWTDWEASYRDHQLPALAQAQEAHADELGFQRFLQFQFWRQWQGLRASATERGIGLIGDLPIFVSHDSADVWAHRELFDLDAQGQATEVAGVPPDYFSADGQRWGNPLYRWDVHQATAYQWWVARFWRLLQLFDAVRVDHFIGFHRYWAIPASSPTAKDGVYRPGPAAAFFEALRSQLGGLPIIAEDLGVLTPEVDALRESFGLPGMRVLQFSFGGDPKQLPSAFAEDCVVYTGTHDNNTTRGWLDDPATAGAGPEAVAAHAAERERALEWVEGKGQGDPVWGLIEAALESLPRLAVIPAQDILGLGEAYRMNTPGTVEGNWSFRLEPGALGPEAAQRLRALTEKHHRL
jgi:4-alpha-glucanotransferase